MFFSISKSTNFSIVQHANVPNSITFGGKGLSFALLPPTTCFQFSVIYGQKTCFQLIAPTILLSNLISPGVNGLFSLFCPHTAHFQISYLWGIRLVFGFLPPLPCFQTPTPLGQKTCFRLFAPTTLLSNLNFSGADSLISTFCPHGLVHTKQMVSNEILCFYILPPIYIIYKCYLYFSPPPTPFPSYLGFLLTPFSARRTLPRPLTFPLNQKAVSRLFKP